MYVLHTNTEILVTDETVDGCYDKLDAIEHDWDGVMLSMLVGGEFIPVEVE